MIARGSQKRDIKKTPRKEDATESFDGRAIIESSARGEDLNGKNFILFSRTTPSRVYRDCGALRCKLLYGGSRLGRPQMRRRDRSAIVSVHLNRKKNSLFGDW